MEYSKRLEYQVYMKSLAWEALRYQALNRAGYICELCGAKATEVHHKTYPDDFAKDSLDNLQALCRVCHMAITLDTKCKKLSEKFSRETDPGKIYMALLAWSVEVSNYSRG